MKAVDNNGCIWETLFGYAIHGITEVHRDFPYLCKFFRRYLLDYSGYDLRLCPLDYRDDGTFAAMPGLVGKNSIHLLAQLGLIYTAMLPDILGNQYPVDGMFFLLPSLIVTEVVLVVTFDLATLKMEESP